MSRPRFSARRTRLLTGTAIVGIAVSALLEVTVQLLPPHYSALRQPESDLAVGPYGALEDLSFLVRAAATFAIVLALAGRMPQTGARAGRVLMGLSALGKAVIAFAVTDLTPRPTTLHGAVHAVAALASFSCGGIGAWLTARAMTRESRPRRPGLLVGLASANLGLSLLAVGTVTVSERIGVWGLLERLCTISFLGWLLVVAFEMRRGAGQSVRLAS
jgi:hypothetical protein